MFNVEEKINVEEEISAGKTDFESVERTLTTALMAWSATSVAVGTSLVLVGHQMKRDQLSTFGRQNAAWGVVDSIIAGAGVFSRSRRAPLSHEQAAKKARSLRKVLLANAVADVGYIAGGLVIAVRGRRGESTLRMGVGDGAAIVLQGAFLLALDLSQARRL